MSEAYDDYCIEMELLDLKRRAISKEIKNNFNNGVWVTKDKKLLKISEMGTDHIKNCIKMIEREDYEDLECYIDVFKKELERR